MLVDWRKEALGLAQRILNTSMWLRLKIPDLVRLAEGVIDLDAESSKASELFMTYWREQDPELRKQHYEDYLEFIRDETV